LPKTIQTILLSATLNDEVVLLKKLYLHNSVMLKLKENEILPCSIQLEQYQIRLVVTALAAPVHKHLNSRFPVARKKRTSLSFSTRFSS
jgi:hypothetical protein